MHQKSKSAKSPSQSSYQSPFSLEEFISLLLIGSFLFVDFIPQSGSVDIMGPQWVYLSILNGVCLFFLLTLGRKTLYQYLGSWSQSLVSISFIGFFIIAGLSIFGAINEIESLVVYSRLITTLLMYFNIGLLLASRLSLIRAITVVVMILSIVQSIKIFGQFNQEITEGQALDTVISNLKGNSGNKNILAASLAIEVSFILYLVINMNNWLRLIPSVVLLFGTASIVLVNARSSFVSVGIQLLLSLIFIIYWTIREGNLKTGISKICWALFPIIIGAFLGNAIISQTIREQAGPSETTTVKTSGYRTIQERVKTIKLETSGRDNLWLSAIDFIKKHPLTGAGIGNWKVASIPYEKDKIDEFFVAYHAHNDFLEMTAETGWLGGLLFLGIFITATIYLIRVLFNRKKSHYYWHAFGISLPLASYFIDATFNFPCERPIMQMYLAFTLSSITCLWISQKNIQSISQKVVLPSYLIGAVGFVGVSLALISYGVNKKVLTSMKAQAYINADALKLEPELSFEKVNADLPSFPNLNAFCFSPDVIKSRYLIKEKKFNEALVLLERSRKVSAQLSINEQFSSMAFLGLNNKDSAFYWIEKAFYYRPRVRNNYILYNQLLVEKKDSIGIEKAFQRLRSVREEGYVWGVYLNSLIQIGASLDRIKILTDSAIQKFPYDPDMQNRNKMLAAENAKPFAAEGLKYFASGQYAKAVNLYKKAAEINPSDYAFFENVGLCYLGQNRFAEALTWFEKVIQMGSARDAKSIFYKGISLVRMGRKEEGCQWLSRAAGQNYPGAIEEMRANNCQ